MLPTPDLSILPSSTYEHVYEPAEDSFLLLDALEKDMNRIRQLSPALCLEIGSGSGIATSFLGKHLNLPAMFITTDKNPHACTATKLLASGCHVDVAPVLTDLVKSLQPNINGKVDILLFNPPYVPTPLEEINSHGIEASWAGGPNGRVIIDQLLPKIPELLAPGGLGYMILLKENDIPDVQEKLANAGIVSSVCMQRKCGEHLHVLKMYHEKAEIL